MARQATETPPRRRRRPEEAEQEILDAAAQLLREHRASEVTVAAIMERTTLSRKSFYVYFRDRHELITRLVRPLRAELDVLTERALAEARDPTGREAFLTLARVYMEHGQVLRALAEASTEDPEAARAWRDFTEPPIAVIADRIRAEIAAGRIAPTRDVDAMARALVTMNLHCFFEQLVGRRDADPEALVDTLHEIWHRALYDARPAGFTPAADAPSP